jgi:hypothetical protein
MGTPLIFGQSVTDPSVRLRLRLALSEAMVNFFSIEDAFRLSECRKDDTSYVASKKVFCVHVVIVLHASKNQTCG